MSLVVVGNSSFHPSLRFGGGGRGEASKWLETAVNVAAVLHLQIEPIQQC